MLNIHEPGELIDESNQSDATYSNTDIRAEKSDKELELQREEEEVDADPNIDRGYAWVICFACVLFNFSTYGMNSGFAIYFATYVNQGTFPGATKIDYAYIGGLAFGAGLLFSPVITVLMGLLGFRTVLIIGNCLQFTSLMLASWSTKLWQLYLTQGVMQSFGLAFLGIPATTILPQYFKKKRVLAGGIGAAGSGLGGIVFNLAMQKVVDEKGVPWALRAQSIIAFGLIWIAIILAKSKADTHNIQFKFFDVNIVKTAPFWMLIFFVITCIFGYVILLYTLSNFTTSLGYTERQGSYASALVQVGSCVGRPIVGLISDRFGGATVACVGYYIVGIFCLAMWIPARNLATVLVFAVIQGSLMGAIYGMSAPLMARLFGIKKMNIVFAQAWTIMGVAGIWSPVIGVKLTSGSGAGLDPTRYVNCAIFTGVCFMACATALLLIRGYVKSRDKIMEEQGHTDSDLLDYTGVSVPFFSVFTHCFATSKEKV
ncbi:MCH2 Probable transporter MCH2 [Candida maltosa Xu316]